MDIFVPVARKLTLNYHGDSRQHGRANGKLVIDRMDGHGVERCVHLVQVQSFDAVDPQVDDQLTGTVDTRVTIRPKVAVGGRPSLSRRRTDLRSSWRLLRDLACSQ